MENRPPFRVSDAIKGAKPVAFVVCKPNTTLIEDAVS
jgi:hypothetical protein